MNKLKCIQVGEAFKDYFTLMGEYHTHEPFGFVEGNIGDRWSLEGDGVTILQTELCISSPLVAKFEVIK